MMSNPATLPEHLAPPPAQAVNGPGASAATVPQRPLRVAIVHYWLVSYGGGESVVQAMLELFPQAEIFTLLKEETVARKLFGDRPVHTSFLQKIPFARRIHRKLLPLMPVALENLDLSGFDLILSSESGPAKGIVTPLGAVHLCYCHSPMRYLWDQYHDYRRSSGRLSSFFMSLCIVPLRMWDTLSARRVDYFMANSRHIRRRIQQFYNRDAEVVHPPVDTHEFAISPEVDDYYLITGRHVAYKRIDLAVQACTRLGRRLVVTGEGPDTEALKRMAGPTVQFVGHCSFNELKRYYARCRAFLMPAEEDFGIAPVEAMASGRPVIAYGRGGALDTVDPDVTGILFPEQSVESLTEAIVRFEAEEETLFRPETIKAHAERFSRANFLSRFNAVVEQALAEHASDRSWHRD